MPHSSTSQCVTALTAPAEGAVSASTSAAEANRPYVDEFGSDVASSRALRAAAPWGELRRPVRAHVSYRHEGQERGVERERLRAPGTQTWPRTDREANDGLFHRGGAPNPPQCIR